MDFIQDLFANNARGPYQRLPTHDPNAESSRALVSLRAPEQPDQVDSAGRPQAPRIPDVRSWLRSPWKTVQNAYAFANEAADKAYKSRVVEGSFAVLVKEFPPDGAIAAFYTCDGPRAQRLTALNRAKPIVLKAFGRVLTEALRNDTFNDRSIGYVRRWLDQLLGPCSTWQEARKRCMRLYLTQHPDKTGFRDYGTPLANMRAGNMYELLNTTKTLLTNESLGVRLYPPPSAPSMSARGVGYTAFFLLLVGAGYASSQLASERPSIMP